MILLLFFNKLSRAVTESGRCCFAGRANILFGKFTKCKDLLHKVRANKRKYYYVEQFLIRLESFDMLTCVRISRNEAPGQH
jgi:hypothetical protein